MISSVISNVRRIWGLGLVSVVLMFAQPIGRMDVRPDPWRDALILRAIYSQPSSEWPAALIDADVSYRELAAVQLPDRPAPGSAAAAKRDLGARLFNEPALSASGQISCQSCHNRNLGWGDGLPRSIGHNRTVGSRNAPALFSAGARRSLFWDGRTATLEEQIAGPLLNPIEMANQNLVEVRDRIAAQQDLKARFSNAFGDSAVTLDRILSALAEFERGLEEQTRFDRFLSGETDALSDSQLRGLHLFRTKARCANCHNGPLLTDDNFHNLGLSFYGRNNQDLGRYEVTGRTEDIGRFRTPSLRHLAKTAPYMHNGLMPHLKGVVAFYNAGGAQISARTIEQERDLNFQAASQVSPHLKPLNLTRDEMDDIVDFLNGL